MQMDILGKGKSILEGALNLGQERRRETSEPPDQSAFIDRFNLLSILRTESTSA